MFVRSTTVAFLALILLDLAVPAVAGAQVLGSIQGHVWMPNGEPLVGTTVHLEPAAGGLTLTHTTDSTGRFQFEAPANVNYRIQAEMVGFDVGQRVVGVKAGAVTHVAFILSVGALTDHTRDIRGQVVDESARPVNGAYVTVSGLNDGVARTVVTGSGGEFVLERVSSKPLVLIAVAPGASAAAAIPVSRGARSVRLVLSKMMAESVQ